MISIEDFKKISPFHWILEKDKKLGMRTNADFFATEQMIENAIKDASFQQVINVSALPEIVSNSIAMPDIHYGYGFCIGGVAAFPADSGIVLPGGVGYDINCGVRLLSTAVDVEDFKNTGEEMGLNILRNIPTGLGGKTSEKLGKKEFLKIIKNGAEEIISHFGGNKEDLKYIESGGKLEFNIPKIISEKAYERGRSQVGSLGSGNHFIEIQVVDKIYDSEAADVFGLKPGKISIMIHTGSRGFGHQVATDYIEIIRKKNLSKIKIKDPQLIYAFVDSNEGRNYLQALNAASNFAWGNRQLLMEKLIIIFERIFMSSRKDLDIRLIYDQAHNIAKFEDHMIMGGKKKVLVHRKGATRAFPPGHLEIPKKYQNTGQPVIIPGSMGTASYVLKGTQKAMDVAFGSSAHGAGRKMSRHKAIKFSSGMDVQAKLKGKGIHVFSYSKRGLQEEIPEAYKEIDEVIQVTETTGISKKVARLIPLVVVKG